MAKGLDIANTKLPRLENGALGDSWADCILAHALLDEARALLGELHANPTQIITCRVLLLKLVMSSEHS